MSDRKRILTGMACGIGAGALWGLVFLAPALVHEVSPIWLTIGRYLFYGLFSACLIAPAWRRLVPLLGRREWIALAWLAFFGNVFYFLLLSSAVQMGGIAMASLVMGFLPVVVTIIGSRHRSAVPLRQLMPSIVLFIAGALCIGWQAIDVPEGVSVATQLGGLLCAIGALASWTVYALRNRHWLQRLEGVSSHEWNLLTGVMTCAQTLLLVPIALVFFAQSHGLDVWGRLIAVSAGVAVLASMIGNGLWNRMSRLLPLTLVGQMIVFETLFALIYGFIWESRGPTVLEAMAFALVVASVVSCLSAHARHGRRPEPAALSPHD
ncbi:DMT family transporter [Xanthomonadaceae bacterium JHOS43]|nr:DMT family transporter [Xanthomonadaceae bacterium JHOS43]